MIIYLLLLVGLAWVVFSNRSIELRVKALELKIKSGAILENTYSINTQDNSSQTLNVDMTAPRVLNSIPQVEAENHLSAWLKEDWLMKLGAFLFIIGFGWFVSYAFANNWIGPVGRIGLGIFGGTAIMAFGYIRMLSHIGQGAVFMSLGAGMAIMTIFAGRSLYGFFTPATAVLFDFLIVSFVSFASYKFKIKSLAYLAQVLAFTVPLFVPGSIEAVFLFSYLFFISLATLFLAGVTGWREMIVSSLVFVGLYSFPYIYSPFGYNNYLADAPIILNFAYAFAMLYLLAGMFAVISKGAAEKRTELILAACNGLFLFTWIASVANTDWKSLIFATWALAFGVISFLAFRISANSTPFYAYASVAAAFFAAATAAELDGRTLVIAFTVEILFLVLSVLSLTKNPKTATKTSWLFVIPAVLSYLSMAHYANSSQLFSADFFVLALLAFALICVGRFISMAAKHVQIKEDNDAGSYIGVIGTLYVWFILWRFIHILMLQSPDIATMIALIIFTLVGLGVYFNGLYGENKARRVYGVALLSFVVLRLLFVEVWNMELFGKVITFVTIGVLLMSTAFITKKKKHELEINGK